MATPFILHSNDAKAILRGGGASPSDPIAQILATMVSGQWKELTGANAGNFNSALPPLDLAHWDYGVGNGGSPTTWATTPSLPSANSHGVFAFSASCVRSDGEVNHFGGGHTDGGDNSVFRFSAKAACQNILGLGGSRSWSLLVPGGFYLPQAAAKPKGSFEGFSKSESVITTGTYGAGANSISVASIRTPSGATVGTGWTVGGPDIPLLTTVASISGSGPYTITLSGGVTLNAGTNQPIGFSHNVFWATTNVNGDLRTIASHAYWDCIALGLTGFWTVCGGVAWSGNADIVGSTAQEIVGDNGRTKPTGQIGSSNTNSGYAIGGNPMWCDLDSCVYCWQGNGVNHLFRISNPTTTMPTLTDFGAINPGTSNSTNQPSVIARFPDSSHRAIFSFLSVSNFALCEDITGVGGNPNSSNGHIFSLGSVPTIATPTTYLSLCFDNKRSRITVFYGTGQLSYITLGSDPSSATWIQESSGSISGDLPSYTGSNTYHFSRIEYLPVQDAYIVAMGGHVWLRKP